MARLSADNPASGELGPIERASTWFRSKVGAAITVATLAVPTIACDDSGDDQDTVAHTDMGDGDGDAEETPPSDLPEDESGDGDGDSGDGDGDPTTGEETPTDTEGDGDGDGDGDPTSGDGDSGDGDGEPTGDGDGDTGTETGEDPEMWAENAEVDCSQTVEGGNTGGECKPGGKNYYFTFEGAPDIAYCEQPTVKFVMQEYNQEEEWNPGTCQAGMEILNIDGKRIFRGILTTGNVADVDIEITVPCFDESGEYSMEVPIIQWID